jgi:hypothetical protein
MIDTVFSAKRFLTAAAAGGTVIATFSLGMVPMAAHAATMADVSVTAVSAPVQHVEVDENGVPSLRVSYAGLDLGNADDRSELNRRIPMPRPASAPLCAAIRSIRNARRPIRPAVLTRSPGGRLGSTVSGIDPECAEPPQRLLPRITTWP